MRILIERVLLLAAFFGTGLVGLFHGSLAAQAPDATGPSPAPVKTFPSQVLDDIRARPSDLAIFSREDVWRHVKVSQDLFPNGRLDLPWLAESPATLPPDGEFRPGYTPYWCAEVPGWLEVDLGQPCYVAQVVVYPFTDTFGLTEFQVKLLGNNGQEIDTRPPAQVSEATRAVPGSVAQAPPFVLSFEPRAAQRLKFFFTGSGSPESNKLYVKRIRVLGRPVRARHVCEAATLTPDQSDELQTHVRNLAAFPRDGVSSHVRVSGDQSPHGNLEIPWTESASEKAPTPYWCAPAPAWAEVDLGQACLLNAVQIQPWSAVYGVSAFYVKIYNDRGEEVDTVPPCQGEAAIGDSADFRAKPDPFFVSFEPVRSDKIKFYFTRGGAKPEFVYVENVQVLGVPAE
ncbi:MAG: hypothetical protein HY706_20660 [Candidatus Hydrogenedentes bacterium]|nr:hypothetical protein [Candidatus Hydrogenedentota bacterium]